MSRIRPTAAQSRAILAAIDNEATVNAEHVIALKEAAGRVGALFPDPPGLSDEAQREWINWVLREIG